MQDLQVVEHNNEFYVDSREVAGLKEVKRNMAEKTQQPSAELCQYWFEFMWKHGAIQKTYEQEMKK